MSIDYGLIKSGIAVTDPLQIVVGGLDTVKTSDLMSFLSEYIAREEVEEIVVGYPYHPDGTPAQITPQIEKFAARLRKQFKEITVTFHDESYTSKRAKEVILLSGRKRKDRRDKSLVDKVSAILILQDYLKHY